MQLQKKLEVILEKYHRSIFDAFGSYIAKNSDISTYNDKQFLELLYAPRKSFLSFCDTRNLNRATAAGTILEWTMFNFLDATLCMCSKQNIACVINGHQISYKWKSAGTRKLNLDLVIKNRQSRKLYYAFEIKTNFEDGFKKFREEERRLYHHRRKVFPNFRYFYLSLGPPPAITSNKYKRDLNILKRRGELFVFNERDKRYPGAKEFLETVIGGIQGIGQ